MRNLHGEASSFASNAAALPAGQRFAGRVGGPTIARLLALLRLRIACTIVVI